MLDSREGRPLALEDGCNHLRRKRLLGCLREREANQLNDTLE